MCRHKAQGVECLLRGGRVVVVAAAAQARRGDVGVDPNQHDRHAIGVLEMYRRFVNVFGDRLPGGPVGQQRAIAAPGERQFFRGAAVTGNCIQPQFQRAGAFGRNRAPRPCA